MLSITKVSVVVLNIINMLSVIVQDVILINVVTRFVSVALFCFFTKRARLELITIGRGRINIFILAILIFA
jgi:hypothetical protein